MNNHFALEGPMQRPWSAATMGLCILLGGAAMACTARPESGDGGGVPRLRGSEAGTGDSASDGGGAGRDASSDRRVATDSSADAFTAQDAQDGQDGQDTQDAQDASDSGDEPQCGQQARSNPLGSVPQFTGAPEWRGVLEGFYGTPYSHAERMALVDFIALQGLNTYLYAPKDDLYQRGALPEDSVTWRDAYDVQDSQAFAALSVHAQGLGVQLMFGISPGRDYGVREDDDTALVGKLQQLFDFGVRSFVVLFDDIAAKHPASDPALQVQIINRAYDYLRAQDSAVHVSFVPSFYAGTQQQFEDNTAPLVFLNALRPSEPRDHFEAYRQGLPSDVPMFWTGHGVFAEHMTRSDALAMRDWLERDVILWDNVPVNDGALEAELHLAPYAYREAELGGALKGVLANTMLQPRASRVALHSMASAFALGRAYDAERALEEAVVAIGLGAPDALRLLAEQFQSHFVIGDYCESARSAALMSAYWAQPDPATTAALNEHFVELAGVEAGIATLDDALLATELAGPASKLSAYGRAGLLALEVLSAATAGEGYDRTALDAELSVAAQSTWRVGANTTREELASYVGAANFRPSYLGQGPTNVSNVYVDFFEKVLSRL